MSNNEKKNPVSFFMKESWLLIVSAILFGSLLAVCYAVCQPYINENEIKKFNTLAGGLLTEASSFEAVPETFPIDIGKGKIYTVEVKKGLNAEGKIVGWAFVCEGGGFADKIKLVVAADAGFEKLAGFGVLSSNETPGFGDKINPTGPGTFQQQFIGTPATDLELVKIGDPEKVDTQIVAISGATVTSTAVIDIFNTFLVPVKEAMQAKGLLSEQLTVIHKDGFNVQ